MMKSEFESLAGRNVTNEQYKAIETLYMSSNLEKAEFVKSIRTMLKSIPQPEKKKDIKRMAVRDRSGYRKTPNGCYYHIEYVELVDIDIKTGKYIIKPLEDKDFEQLAKDGHDLNLNTWFDFDYEDCIDEKKRPIVPFDELLTWSIANAKTISNSYGEIKIDKALDEDRIDPIDAIIDAWKAAMKEEYKPDTNEVVNEWLEMYEKYMGKGGEKE